MNKLRHLGNEVVRLRQKLNELAPYMGVVKKIRKDSWAEFCEDLLELVNEIRLNAEPLKPIKDEQFNGVKAYFEVILVDDDQVEDFFSNPDSFCMKACNLKKVNKQDIED